MLVWESSVPKTLALRLSDLSVGLKTPQWLYFHNFKKEQVCPCPEGPAAAQVNLKWASPLRTLSCKHLPGCVSTSRGAAKLSVRGKNGLQLLRGNIENSPGSLLLDRNSHSLVYITHLWICRRLSRKQLNRGVTWIILWAHLSQDISGSGEN